ncbi:MAG: hypothetical protein AAF587_28045 [Bacteroidota bacterium]
MLSLTDLCKHTLEKDFGISAFLIPGSAPIHLGDYGYYIQGRFVRKGNLFSDYGLDTEDYLRSSLEESEISNYLLMTPNGELHEAEALVNKKGILYGSVNIRFTRHSGLIMHLRKVRNDMIAMDQCIVSMIEERIRDHAWDDEFRLVWQREVAEEARFAYTHSPQGGELALLGKIEHGFANYAELELKPDLAFCQNMNLDGWVRGPLQYTPMVNFARYSPESELGRGLEGIDGYEDVGFETERLVLDNSDSVL